MDVTASWLTIAPAIIFLVGICFVPPSPRYLAITGKPHTAKKLLLKHRYKTATIAADLEGWLSSKDVFGLRNLVADMKYVKLYLPVLGLSLLELCMGPAVVLFFLQEISFYICKSLGQLPIEMVRDGAAELNPPHFGEGPTSPVFCIFCIFL